MWEMRRRTENTYWSNDTPITDLHEGLDAIAGHKTYLYTGHDLADQTQPEIRQDFSEDSSGYRIFYLEIDPELARRLIAEKLVTPIQTPYPGYTKTVKDRLALSPAGWEKRDSLHEEKGLLAQSMLKAEEDRALGDVIHFRHGRKHRGRWGEIFFDFKLSSGEKVRVFPDKGRVEKLEKEKVLLDATEDDN